MSDMLEHDWKQYRKNIAEWQEKYISGVNRQMMLILTEDENPSEKFWKIDELVKKAKNNPGVVIHNSSRSKLYSIMIDLVLYGVITKEDIADFSEDMKQALEASFERRNNER